MAEVCYYKVTRQYIIDEYPSSVFVKDPWSIRDSKDGPIPEYTIQDYTRQTTTNEDLRKQLELVTSQYLEIKERMDQMEQRERELIKKLMEMVSGPDDKAST